MKSLFALSIILSAALAHADLYQDRMRATAERQNQNTAQDLISRYKKAEVKRVNEIIAFGRTFSGYAAAPECEDYGYRSNSSSWRTTTYQSCAGNFCVNVKSGGASYAGRENDANYVQFALFDMGIRSCRVELKNGLACEISYMVNADAFGGNCIDANGRQRILKLPNK